MSQKNQALETYRTYIHKSRAREREDGMNPKATAVQQRVLKRLMVKLTQLGPVTEKAGPGHPNLCGRGSLACLRAWTWKGHALQTGVISMCSLSALFQLGRNFFLNFKIFSLSHSLLYFPIRHHLSSCPSALLHPEDTIFFLLLNSRPLFLPFFYWSIIATQCYASFCRTMQ